ncbi:MAG: hypothetical protein KJO35_06500 [Gammaproteobacteria bacterium]|nr:hypothetical protein [Gammaproteobacteria bacterium]
MPSSHLISFALIAASLALVSCTDDGGWIQQIGGLNQDSVFGITATDDGRACVTGTFISKVDFGTEAVPLMRDSGGYSDIFVACYGSDGTPVFATHFGVTQKNDQPRAIAALPGGDIVTTGFFSRTFGTEPDEVLQAHGAANADIYLARVNSKGETVWARRYGGSKTDNGRALAADADGNILLAGNFQDVMPYTENGSGQKLVSAGSRDAFLFKLNSQGDILWGRRFGGAAADEAFAVTTTSEGNIVVAGTFAGEASGDAGPTLNANGFNDIFLQGWSPDGDLLWTTGFGGGGQEYIGGLTAGDDGQVWLAGSFQREIQFAGGTTLASEGSTDGMLIRVNSQGEINETLRLGGPDVELVYGIDTTADGDLLLTGHFQNDADLDPGPGKAVYTSSGTNDTDGFILFLDRNAQHLDAVILAGDDVAIGNGIVALPDGGLALSGIFGKEMRVKGAGNQVIKSNGKSDSFIMGIPAP